MLCVICAPCGLAWFYWTKKRNVEARREGLWTFIKWPTRLQTCQPEAQNWVSCLMWGLQTCADSWPSVNNATVTRAWTGSPHTLCFPWAPDESTPTQDAASALLIETFIWSSEGAVNYLSQVLLFHDTRQETSHCKFSFKCTFKFICMCDLIICSECDDFTNDKFSLPVSFKTPVKSYIILLHLLCAHVSHVTGWAAGCQAVIGVAYSRMAALLGSGSETK